LELPSNDEGLLQVDAFDSISITENGGYIATGAARQSSKVAVLEETKLLPQLHSSTVLT
jgi:hypothetical protein